MCGCYSRWRRRRCRKKIQIQCVIWIIFRTWSSHILLFIRHTHTHTHPAHSHQIFSDMSIWSVLAAADELRQYCAPPPPMTCLHECTKNCGGRAQIDEDRWQNFIMFALRNSPTLSPQTHTHTHRHTKSGLWSTVSCHSVGVFVLLPDAELHVGDIYRRDCRTIAFAWKW